MNCRNLLVVSLLTLLAAVVLSCGGGGHSASVPELEGTWLGVLESSGGTYVYRMTINTAGEISEIMENGVVVPRSAAVVRETDRLYSIEYESGAFGGFIVDEGADHALYLDNWSYVGVLQKGALQFPDPGHFVYQDYVDSWSGYSVWMNSAMQVTKEGTTALAVDSDYNVIGTALAGAFAGTIFGWSAGTSYYGVAEGEDTEGDLFFRMFLSVDKEFMATYACPWGIIEFYDCEYGGWSRQ
ncbi:MAG: hypothetical protein PVJ01_05190 [Pseudomonadota bacterium]